MTYAVGSEDDTSVTADEGSAVLDLTLGSRVRVTMDGGAAVLEDVKVTGVQYSTKDILKLKVKATLGDLDYIIRDLISGIDEFEYED